LIFSPILHPNNKRASFLLLLIKWVLNKPAHIVSKLLCPLCELQTSNRKMFPKLSQKMNSQSSQSDDTCWESLKFWDKITKKLHHSSITDSTEHLTNMTICYWMRAPQSYHISCCFLIFLHLPKSFLACSYSLVGFKLITWSLSVP